MHIHAPKKRRSESRTMVYRMMYGRICHKYLPTKIKKGAGKGRTRMQRVKIDIRNSVDYYHKSL